VSPQRDRKARRATRQAAPGRDRTSARRRLGLLVFAVLFVALFAGFAIAQGIGKPDIPSGAIVVVDNAPSDDTVVTDCDGKQVPRDPGTITQAEFDCALKQTAAQGGIKKVPKPGDKQYEDLKNAALGDLLDMVWIQGEAEDRGITVSKREVDAQLEQIVTQNFTCKQGQDPFDCKQLQQFLKSSHFSEDDVLQRVKLQLLSSELQKQITDAVPPVTDQEISDYYDAAKDQFTTPASRDVRLVLNRDKAKVEEAKSQLEQDDSPASWKKVASQFSTDVSSKSNGGLRPGLTEGLVEEPLNSAIFDATQGQIEGPIKTPLGYYVFEVEKITPEKAQPLSQLKAQISSQLHQTAQQEAFTRFVDDYGSKWQSRTICASGFVIERCSNFASGGHPPNAPADCYVANPKKGRPDACPAPVVQLTPALPGSVNDALPQGVRLPQRPRPAGLTPIGQSGLPGATGGGAGVPITPSP
jgi:parvulin-like peptidyl-prolyl isomerase